jgi:pyruvate kinase
MDRQVDIKRLSDQLASICERARKLESDFSDELSAVHPEFRDSARNLVHYLALRQSDVSELQDGLSDLGLSSLERVERDVMGSLRAVWSALQQLTGGTNKDAGLEGASLPLSGAPADAHKTAILGDRPEGRDVSIMVTLPTEAGQSRELVSEMIAAGMNIARVNCAHDAATCWETMIENVRAASAEAGNDCKVIMDLAGPKLRTGELRPGPRVLHLRPRRDPLGRVIAPRRVRFMPDDIPQRGTKAAVIPVPRECVEYAEPGDEIRFKDTRGKKRRLTIVSKDEKGLLLDTYKGAYIATGSKFRLIRRDTGETLVYRIGELAPVEQPILLREGDTLILHRSNVPGAPAKEDADGNVTAAAHIACQQPEVFEFVPGSDIRLPGLTAADKKNLRFVIEHADAVCLSFVREPADILLLQEELEQFSKKHLGVVIKIETKRGFKNLPRLILTAMRSYPAAIMIARGDLAVECGWERLAELQEEILWFCEAAQMPVMWATQVLEQEAKKGQPSRAEISDAAMSQRADCVMLNKGPHILAAIRMLDDILRRMQKHQFKKTARMRKLSVSDSK